VIVGLEAWFEASRSVHAAGADVGFQLFGVAARVGVSALHAGRFELIPMLSARGGWVRNLPESLADVRNGIRWTMLTGPGVLVRAKLGAHWFAEALPELEVVVIRDRLQIETEDKLYRFPRPSLFEARLSLGIGYEFP
jgi:hypothetical protein